MDIEAAPYVCYVASCNEPMASMTQPVIGPCVNHTDDDVRETLAHMRKLLEQQRVERRDRR
jgi:hypothetical protein